MTREQRLVELLDEAEHYVTDMELRSRISTALASPAHTDHPLRHFDRTCPACLAEGEQNAAPQGTTPNDRA